MSTTDTIQRAFELAATGRYRRPSEITRALSKEGFMAAEMHLSGASIRKQLRELIANSTGSS